MGYKNLTKKISFLKKVVLKKLTIWELCINNPKLRKKKSSTNTLYSLKQTENYLFFIFFLQKQELFALENKC